MVLGSRLNNGDSKVVDVGQAKPGGAVENGAGLEVGWSRKECGPERERGKKGFCYLHGVCKYNV